MQVVEVPADYKPMTSPLKWHGGKGGHHGRLASWIVSLLPEHTHRVHSYVGAFNTLLYCNPDGYSEVANDKNNLLINFFHLLRDPTRNGGLFASLSFAPFSSVDYEQSHKVISEYIASGKNALHEGDVTRIVLATHFFAYCRMSLAGRMDQFTPRTRTRTRRMMNEQVSAWFRSIDRLPEVAERLERVVMLNMDAIDCMAEEDSQATCFVLDPPYLHETRVTVGEYGPHEMTREQHEELLEALLHVKGSFALSGYHSELYDDWSRENGFECHEFEVTKSSSSLKTKPKAIECLWVKSSGWKR